MYGRSDFQNEPGGQGFMYSYLLLLQLPDITAADIILPKVVSPCVGRRL